MRGRLRRARRRGSPRPGDGDLSALRRRDREAERASHTDVLSSHIRPPNSPTMRRDSVSPSPVPSSLERAPAALLEGLEDPLLVLRRDADAGVVEGDHGLIHPRPRPR